ncbi:MAG: hypothetical protein RLZZ618_1547, partial [Pseudomonadota bacterium]
MTDASSPNAAPSPTPTHRAWASLIEGLIDAVWLVDAKSLRIVAANGPAGLLFGVEPVALLGRGVAELSATPEDLAFWDDVAAGWTESILSESLVCRFDGRV